MKLNARTKVDLHIHTAASDGSWSPEKVIEETLKNKVGLMAVTDHDEVINIEPVKKLALENGIAFLAGIEISSSLDGSIFHILAYGVDYKNNQLSDLLQRNRYLLEKKDDDSIKYLIEKEYDIDYDKYDRYINDRSRGGWKALNFLIDEGICSDVGDYFNRLFAGEIEIQFPVFNHPEEVIKIIKKAGGIPVLAHPYYSTEEIPVHERLNLFYEMGVEGVECYHPNHTNKITEECLKWCRNRNLIITVGSDCHGDFIKSRIIGKPEVYIDQLNLGRLEHYINKKFINS